MPTPLRCDPALFKKDLSGKVILITGATAGIGLTTATQLVKQHATVVMAGRNEVDGKAAAAQAGGSFMQLDLASLRSVRDFAAAFLAKYVRLDVLVNNAGVMMPPLSRTKDGFELQMGTNHLGHFLLTELLKDLLEKSAPSRVVILSSCGAAPCKPQLGEFCKIDFSDLNWKTRTYHKGEAYAQSKLANCLHAMEIAKRYKGVTAYSLHPGQVQTNLFRHSIPAWLSGCFERFSLCTGFMIDVWDGTQTSLHCILSEPEELVNGAFYSQLGMYEDPASRGGGWPLKMPNAEANDSNAARLWEESAQLVGLSDPATE